MSGDRHIELLQDEAEICGFPYDLFTLALIILLVNTSISEAVSESSLPQKLFDLHLSFTLNTPVKDT